MRERVEERPNKTERKLALLSPAEANQQGLSPSKSYIRFLMGKKMKKEGQKQKLKQSNKNKEQNTANLRPAASGRWLGF